MSFSTELEIWDRNMLINQRLEFAGVTGIAHLKLKLSQKQTNVLVGLNGSGKTRTLEALYAFLMMTNRQFLSFTQEHSLQLAMPFTSCKVNGELVVAERNLLEATSCVHELPVIYVSAGQRGVIAPAHDLEPREITPVSTAKERETWYLYTIARALENSNKTVNLEWDVNEWFVQRALSSNRNQATEDNRELEICLVLKILNQIDARISGNPHDLKVVDSKYACLMCDGELTKLTQLSRGYIALIQIVQTIVAGLGCLTNSTSLQNLAGYVLIDDLDQHLSVAWQNNIMHVLAQAFPHIRFVVTSHSLFLLAQLKNGYAYKLAQDEDGCVVSKFIPHTGKATLIDLVYAAFEVDFNKTRIASDSPEEFKDVKRALASLLKGEDFEELYTGL